MALMGTSMRQPPMRKRSRRFGLWLALASIVTVFVLIFALVIISLAVESNAVTGPAMEPTLHDQDDILVDKASYIFHAPARGDVVVFFAPPAPREKYIKRIIGIPGDVITVNNNTVIVDGTTLNETYVDPAMQGNLSPPIVNEVIPPNEYFVMGDGRRYSSDSREWGFVPRANIIGRATFIYGRKSGFLPDVSSVFANVHQSTHKTTLAQPGK